MHQPTLRARAALALCAAAVTALRAETASETQPTTNLPPIVVQASRTGRTTAEMPANVRIITADEIARGGQQNLVDVLQKQAGVTVKNFSDNPTTASVALRGYGENAHGRVLILVNGERLNNPDLAAPNLMRIPVQSIKRVEVIRGSQTVLYGDFAEAGVINIITDSSIDAKPATTLSASIGSYDTYATRLSTAGAFEDGVSYFASADWNKTGGYRDNGDYEAWNIDASVAKAWQSGQRVSLSTFYHDSEYGLPGALSWQQFQNNPRQTLSPNDRAWFKTWGVNLAGGAPVGADGRFDANLTASRRETDFRYLGASYSSYRSSAIDTVGFTPRYSNDGDVAGFDNQFIVGADLRYDTSRINSYGRSFGSPYAYAWDFDRATLAGYAKDEFFLAESLSITLGGRAEHFANRVASAADTTSYDDSEWACDAALLYRPVEDVRLFSRVARYYHAPFIDETVGWTGAPNTGLAPERGLSVELGAEATIAREWTLGATAYQHDTRDEIYYDPTVYMNINAPDAIRRQGVETSLRWARAGVGAFGVVYDFTDAVFSEGAYDGNDVPLVPNHTVTVNGEVSLTSDLAALGTAHYAASQRSGSDFANALDKLDAYGTLDLALRYEPHFVKGLRLFAGVDNVFDREYAYCSFYGSSYYPAVGRTWKFCASYTF